VHKYTDNFFLMSSISKIFMPGIKGPITWHVKRKATLRQLSWHSLTSSLYSTVFFLLHPQSPILSPVRNWFNNTEKAASPCPKYMDPNPDAGYCIFHFPEANYVKTLIKTEAQLILF
jgi:hypothetical protein